MRRFISVDTGKHACKCAEYNEKTETIKKFHFKTRIGAGDFRDTAIEKNTIIAQYGDKVYKVGQGARGSDATMETSKMDETHRLCTLVALAVLCSSNEVDELSVAIGLPASDWSNVSTRMDFLEYMFPEGEICLKIKARSDAPVIEKRFVIKEKYAYPESIGALLMDDSPTLGPNSYIGVLDIGNLNINATEWCGSEIVAEDSVTDELGGKILIQTISQELQRKLQTRCNEKIVAECLFEHDPNDRHLFAEGAATPERKKQIEEESRIIIKEVMLKHARDIKTICDSLHWSSELMKIITIGGTGKLLESELREVFGQIIILDEPVYCNALGFLRALCKRTLGKIIPLEEKAAEPVKESKAS